MWIAFILALRYNFPMHVHIVPCLHDNYCYVLQHDQEACIIDPGEAVPVIALLQAQNLSLSLILNTHSHFDHTGGNNELLKLPGPSAAAPPRLFSSHSGNLKDGMQINFSGLALEVLATPGHTPDSVCFYLPGKPGLLFTGDTLFGAGCGRLLNGTPGEMWNSLQRLAALPEDTLVYFGHEYTLENLDFGLSLQPGNKSLQQRRAEEEKRIKLHKVTTPSAIGLEKKSNIFLLARAAADFTALRKQKDIYG